jgi:hypothetical protein
MRSIFFIALLIISPVIASAQRRSDPGPAEAYINYKYKGVLPGRTLPNGVKHTGGSMVGDIEADPAYGISSVSRGKTQMLWLEESTGKDSQGITGWRVLDVLAFPALAKTDYLFVPGDPSVECTKAGKEIPNLVGVGRLIRRQDTFRPSKLWVADLKTKKFRAFPLTGVKCVYSEP